MSEVKTYKVIIHTGVSYDCSNYDAFGMCTFSDCLNCDNARYEIIDENGNYIKKLRENEVFNFFSGYIIIVTLEIEDKTVVITEDNLWKVLHDPTIKTIPEDSDYSIYHVVNSLSNDDYIIDGEFALKRDSENKYYFFRLDRKTIDGSINNAFEMIYTLEQNSPHHEEYSPEFIKRISKVQRLGDNSVIVIDTSKINSKINKLILNLKKY